MRSRKEKTNSRRSSAFLLVYNVLLCQVCSFTLLFYDHDRRIKTCFISLNVRFCAAQFPFRQFYFDHEFFSLRNWSGLVHVDQCGTYPVVTNPFSVTTVCFTMSHGINFPFTDFMKWICAPHPRQKVFLGSWALSVILVCLQSFEKFLSFVCLLHTACFQEQVNFFFPLFDQIFKRR